MSLKQLIQEYNLCQQLHHLVLICLAERRCQYHTIELTFSLSFHIPYILKCNHLPKLYHQFLLVMLFPYFRFHTSAFSTSPCRPDYHGKIVCTSQILIVAYANCMFLFQHVTQPCMLSKHFSQCSAQNPDTD